MGDEKQIQEVQVDYVRQDWPAITRALEKGITPEAFAGLPVPLLDWVWVTRANLEDEVNWEDLGQLMQAVRRRGLPASAWSKNPEIAFFKHLNYALVEANEQGLVDWQTHVQGLTTWLDMGVSVQARHTNGRHALAYLMESSMLKFSSHEARQLMAGWGQVMLTRSGDERWLMATLKDGGVYPEFNEVWSQAVSLERERQLHAHVSEAPSRSRLRG